jgi:hypothetical protein
MALFGFMVLIEYYVKISPLSAFVSKLNTTAVILGAFASILGLFNIYRYHYINIKNRQKGLWYLSIITICLLTFSLLYGLTQGIYSSVYQWMWFYLAAQTYAAGLAMSGFFMITAAYRACVARSAEAFVLLIATSAVLIGGAPITVAYLPAFKPVSEWFLSVPSAAAGRGMTIGAGIGTLALGFRLLFGKEKKISLTERGGT